MLNIYLIENIFYNHDQFLKESHDKLQRWRIYKI